MADNGKPHRQSEIKPELLPEIVAAPNPAKEPESSSSDDATSTKSTELPTPEDDSALQSVASGSTPAKSSEASTSNKGDSSRSQTPPDDPPPQNVATGDPARDDQALIPRRRVPHPQENEEELEEIQEQQVAEQVVVVEPARRSPTDRRLLTSLTKGFENSNEYFINFLLKWQAYSLFVSDSRYLVPFQIGLMFVSLANVTIGALYLESCPLSFMLPGLVLVLGIVGIAVMIARMILVLYIYCTDQRIFTNFFRKIVMGLNFFYLVLLSWEFIEYMTKGAPSTDIRSSDYCEPFLLSYAKGYNCAAFSLVFISIILHGPAYLQYSWKIGGPGLPDCRA